MLSSRARSAARGLLGALQSRGVSQLSITVSEELKAAYARDGAVCVRGAFSPDWVARLREGAEHNLSHPGPLCDEHVQPGEPGRFHDDQFLWKRHAVFEDFVFNSPAAALAQAVSGSKAVSIVYDQLFVKEPGTKNATPWHTDHSYWCVPLHC